MRAPGPVAKGLWQRVLNRKTAPVRQNQASSKMDLSRLAEQLDALLRALEFAKSAGVVLRAEDVQRASTLIRLFAEVTGNADAWLDCERARQTARLLKTQRLIGSRPLQRPKPQFFEPQEEPQEKASPKITLFDLVKDFGEILERTKRRQVYDSDAHDPSQSD